MAGDKGMISKPQSEPTINTPKLALSFLEGAQEYLRIEKWQAAISGDTERQWECAKAIDVLICAKREVQRECQPTSRQGADNEG